MRFIGNILTDNKVNVSELYNVVKSETDLIPNIPTLIIGYKKVNLLYPNFSVLDWRIDDLTYWTFGRRERGDVYNKHIEKFKELTISRLITNIKYLLFNVLVEDEENKKNIFNILKGDIKKMIYIENNMLYFCCENENIVRGISLTDIEYEGGNKEKFLSFILKNKNNVLIKNKENISYEIKTQFTNTPYMIPYIMFN